MQIIRYAAGDTIISEGDDGDSAFLIVDGSVEVFVGKGIQARNVATLNAGDVFGEMSLIEPGPRSATVKALGDTECVLTSYDEFMKSVQDSPEQAVEFMKSLVHRLRQMNELMVKTDPRRRRLLDVFRDWQKSLEGSYDEMSQEEKQREQERMMCFLPMF